MKLTKLTKLTKNLSAAALCLSMSFGANAGKLFTVDENPTNDPIANPGDLIVADQITGNYTESITINTDLTFSSTVFATFNGFTLNTNDVDSALIGNTTDAAGYTLYATLTATGNASTFASPFGLGVQLNGFVGDLELWMDVDSNTDYTFGSGTTNSIDDVKLGSSSNASGTGFAYSSALGAFNILFQDFMLADNADTPFNGDDYFASPTPFWNKAETSGTLQGLDPTTVLGTLQTGNSYTGTIGGVINVAFVPEPSTIAILGLALVGFGATSRKKRLTK